MSKSTPKASGQHHARQPKIMACTCKHPYQDECYGQGKRLHNPRKDNKYACTVCGTLKG